MDTLAPLASALGLGMLSGARLYLTVFAVGLLLRLDWITLPAAWQHATVLSDTRVLILSGVACIIEFVADKVPWIDSAWDAVHTFIRPIGAALLTSSLFAGLDPAYRLILPLLAGGVALSGHSVKAATRLAVNHSPEPFSNIALSLGEDALTAAGLYMVVKHPWLMAALAVVTVGLAAWLMPRAYRAVRAEIAAFRAVLRKWMGEPQSARLTPDQDRWVAEHCAGRLRRVFAVIATADLKSCRNAEGTLSLVGDEAVFFTQRWRRRVERKIGPLTAVESKRGILLDKLTLVTTDGRRTRFDLLAGQMEQARDEATYYSTHSSVI